MIDLHIRGLNKKQRDLGIGNGSLFIKKEILSNWNINYV